MNKEALSSLVIGWECNERDTFFEQQQQKKWCSILTPGSGPLTMWVWIFGNMDMFLCLCVLGLGESHVLPLGLMSLGLCVLARALCEPWVRKLLCPSLLHSPLWLVPCLSRS